MLHLYISNFFSEVKLIASRIDHNLVERMIDTLLLIKNQGGRLFIIGVGGSAGNASHAVNDFRKLAGIETYTPVDNVSELTAQINDNGWENVFTEWLKESKLNEKDGLLVLSVGGGSLENNISVNLVRALEYAKDVKSKILGIVGRDGGYTNKVADVCIIIPVVNVNAVTPYTESFQSIILHLLVSHPYLLSAKMTWESVKETEDK